MSLHNNQRKRSLNEKEYGKIARKRSKRYFLRSYINDKLWNNASEIEIDTYLKENKDNLLPEQHRMIEQDLKQIIDPETNILHGGIATGYYFFICKTPIHEMLTPYLNENNENGYSSVCFNMFVRYECQENEKCVTKVRHFFKEHKSQQSKTPYTCFDKIFKGVDYNAQEYRLFVNEELEPFYIDRQRPPLI